MVGLRQLKGGHGEGRRGESSRGFPETAKWPTIMRRQRKFQ